MRLQAECDAVNRAHDPDGGCRTGVLAPMLAKRAPGYTSLGIPHPRIARTPSASDWLS